MYLYLGLGGENEMRLLLRAGCKYFLLCPDYFERLIKKTRGRFLRAAHRIFIDSGAFTFLHQPEKLRSIDLDRYIWEYAQRLKKYQKYITDYVKLDIERFVGLKKVEKWWEYLTRELGKPPIVVWHVERGKDYWRYMLKKYPYVGITREVTRGAEDELAWFTKTAYDNNVKVHGFAITTARALVAYPFYSADSFSWVKSAAVGELMNFDGIMLKGNEKYRRKNGINTKCHQFQALNAVNWAKFQRMLENLW